jgi:hypothetical protein
MLSELPAKESVIDTGRGIKESADQLCMFRNESDLVNTVLTGWRSSRQVSTDPYISPNKVDQPRKYWLEWLLDRASERKYRSFVEQ